MPAYVAFGLRIHSERELPDGVLLGSEDSSPPDVTIRWAPPEGAAVAPSEQALDGWFEFAPELHRFGWPELGAVEIRGGSEVLVRSVRDVAEGLVEHVLLGPVMADILLSRGLVPLHASANCVEAGRSICEQELAHFVVAFVGRSGQGKSTLAAALHRAGHLAHADDLLAVPSEGEPLVPFGISRIKLNPDSARSVGDDPEAMPFVYSGVSKRTKVILSDQARPPRPLRAIYRVLDGAELSITRVDPRKALFEIYKNCFRVDVEQHALGAPELLRRCASVATRVPVFDLVRPRDLAQLAGVVAAVVEHARELEGLSSGLA